MKFQLVLGALEYFFSSAKKDSFALFGRFVMCLPVTSPRDQRRLLMTGVAAVLESSSPMERTGRCSAASLPPPSSHQALAVVLWRDRWKLFGHASWRRLRQLEMRLATRRLIVP